MTREPFNQALKIPGSEAHTLDRTSRCDKGSVFVELLWTIPAFCAALSLLILTGVIVNARSALQDAVTTALSLATTRGNGFAGSPGTIRAIELFVEDPSERTFSELRRLIVSPNRNEDLSLDDVSERYCSTLYHPQTPTNCREDGPLMSRPPIVQLYALAYVSQAMRMHSLGSARFPCARDSLETSGCLDCRFVPGIEPSHAAGLIDRTADDENPPGPSDPIFDPTFSTEEKVALARRRLTLACRYRVDHPAIAVITGISSLVSSDFGRIFEVTAVASIDNR